MEKGKQYFFRSEKHLKNPELSVFMGAEATQLMEGRDYIIKGDKVILSDHVVRKYNLDYNDQVETENI